MKSISVIMPLFNAARYLPEALQSVLSQTYKDFELICINDCSTDDTAKILKEFQVIDARIKIIVNEERLGAGPSRNKGLKTAKGKYVIFLDGDDIFEEELLEKTSSTMERYGTDIVLFESLHAPSELIYNKRMVERSGEFIEEYCKTTFNLRDIDQFDISGAVATWNKMYRRKFLIDNGLEFQSLPSSNDVYFSIMALYCAEKIIWLDDRRVMVYARDHSEPSRISNFRDPLCVYYAFEQLAKELNVRHMFCIYSVLFYNWFKSFMLSAVKRTKDEECKKKFYYFLQNNGIPKCIEYGKEYYNDAEIYDKYVLESFLNQTFESSWFEHPDTYFQVYLKEFGEVVINFVEEKMRQTKKVFLWGMGRNGTSLLKYLTEHGIKLSGIVDCDENKQGQLQGSYVVEKPNDIYERADCILVTSENVYMDISNDVKGRGIILINLMDLLMKGCW